MAMDYWFTDPMIKGLLPLAGASSIQGLSSTFATPRIFLGPNVLPEGPGLGPSPIDAIAVKCPQKKAFVVTDAYGDKSAAKVARILEAGGFVTKTWNKALPEAPLNNVKESGRAMLEFEPDLIVAVGGGSVMDGGKAAWVLYERPDITDLAALSPFTPLGLRKKAHFAAIPTTSGTGSECTSVFVAHDEEAHRKVPVASGELMPDFALLVPEFTFSMPPKLTAGTGLDALAHAMDCIPAIGGSEMTDALALAATQMVFKYLPRAYRNGQDHEARYRMLSAASTAGIAFGQGGVALTHSFGHSLGSLFGIHHGIAVGIFIPYVFQFYQPVTDKCLQLCKALDVMDGSKEESLARLTAKIKALFAEVDVPLNLKDLGISKSDFEKKMEQLVLYTIEDIDTFFSPRPMTADQCEKIFRYAYEGKDIDF
jgi:alcohol dehydrogenase class IV